MPEKSEKRLTLKKIEDNNDLSREDKTAMQMVMVATRGLNIIAENILKLAKNIYDGNKEAQKKIDKLIKGIGNKGGK